jgi:hypothetical protein
MLYFYSKYSPSCQKIGPIIKDIQQHLNMICVDIDHPNIRQYVDSLKLIHSVPSIILSYPSQQRLEIHENADIITFLNKVCTILKKPSVEYYFHLQGLPINNQQSYHQTQQQTNLQNVPSMRVNQPTAPKGKTMLSLGSDVPKGKTNIAVKIDDPFEEEREIEKMMNTSSGDNFKNMYVDRMTNPVKIVKGEGHENMKSSLSTIVEDSQPQTGISLDDMESSQFTTIDETDTTDNSPLLAKPSSVNKSDMMGTNGPPPNKVAEERSDKIKQSMAEMQAERDRMDKMFPNK